MRFFPGCSRGGKGSPASGFLRIPVSPLKTSEHTSVARIAHRKKARMRLSDEWMAPLPRRITRPPDYAGGRPFSMNGLSLCTWRIRQKKALRRRQRLLRGASMNLGLAAGHPHAGRPVTRCAAHRQGRRVSPTARWAICQGHEAVRPSMMGERENVDRRSVGKRIAYLRRPCSLAQIINLVKGDSRMLGDVDRPDAIL